MESCNSTSKIFTNPLTLYLTETVPNKINSIPNINIHFNTCENNNMKPYGGEQIGGRTQVRGHKMFVKRSVVKGYENQHYLW